MGRYYEWIAIGNVSADNNPLTEKNEITLVWNYLYIFKGAGSHMKEVGDDRTTPCESYHVTAKGGSRFFN